VSRRKHREEEHPNHERWLVSYADFITLLFAFFVVMYSISSINEGKYRILSNTLNQVFSDQASNPVAKRTLDPIQVGEVERSEHLLPEQPPPSPSVVDMEGGQSGDEQSELAHASEQIERVLAPYIQDDLIAVKKEKTWVEVEMKSGLLFASGSAELAPTAIPMIDKLADIFHPLDNPINVEGHTDDKPINTPAFPSNWELSAARAASVVHQLMKGGVNPAHMAAIGHGEHHPIADNATEDGRYQNRRVVLIIQSRAMTRYPSANGSLPGAKPSSVGLQPSHH